MKEQRKIFILLMISGICLRTIPLIGQGKTSGSIYQFIVPKKDSMIADATCYAWIPENVGTIRSIIVHLHGCTREGDAKQMIFDVQWQQLAKKWHSVLLAPAFITGGNSKTCTNWYVAGNGSGDVFLQMLDSLSVRAGHPEIKTVPWALWGHSGGSLWITAMTGRYPQRVAVAVAQSCGVDISNVAAALKVPVLHHNGAQDICNNNNQLFANGRSRGALWAHAVNPVVASPMDGHQVHDLRFLAIPWFDACLAMRLPKKPGTAALNEMDTSHTWLGDATSKAIAPSASFKGNRQMACWFPNQQLAEKWVEYVSTGTIKDLSPPAAPYNLNAAYAGNKLTLKWDADADLESGIKTFIIYRNGKVLQTLEYKTKTKYSNQTGYQRWNDGDQPAPVPAPEMTFTDTDVNDKDDYTYEVSSVNWSDVVSKKSGKLRLKKGEIK